MDATGSNRQYKSNDGEDGRAFDMAKMQASLAELQATHTSLKAAIKLKNPIVLTPRAHRHTASKPLLDIKISHPTKRSSNKLSTDEQNFTNLSDLHGPIQSNGKSNNQPGQNPATPSTDWHSNNLPLKTAKAGQLYYDPSVIYTDEIEAAEVPKVKPVPRNLVSGGLTHLTVASDLAFVEFNRSGEEGTGAEPEYRAVPWNVEINPEVGGYGPFESDSQDLLTYLTRLEEQQRVVIEMMKRLAATGGSLPTSSRLPHLPAPISATAHRPYPPPAASSRAGPERKGSSGGQGLPPRAPRALSTPAPRSVPENAAADEGFEDIAAHMWHPAVLGPAHSEPVKKLPRVLPRWRRPVTTAEIASSIQFERTERERGPRQPSHFNWPGLLIVLLWLGAFGFYLYCRIDRTLDRHSNVFAYQIVVLVAEILVGLVTARQGLTLLRRLDPRDPACVSPQKVKGVAAPDKVAPFGGRSLLKGVMEAEPAKSSFKRAQLSDLESLVASTASPALPPTEEAVTASSSDAPVPSPSVDVDAPPANALHKTLKEVKSAVSIYAMDEPSFSGGVSSPGSCQRKVTFEDAPTQKLDKSTDISTDISAPGGACAQGLSTAGDVAVTVTLQTRGKGDNTLQRGSLKLEKGLQDKGAVACRPLERQYHVQVLIFGSTSDLALTEAALRAAHTAGLPEQCTRSIYLVDTHWDTARSDFVLALGLDAITYAPGFQAGKQMTEDWGRASTLNRVLRRLYPEESYGKDNTIANTELVAILDADQIIDSEFFNKSIPASEMRGVRLVQTRISLRDLDLCADIFDMTLHNQFRLTADGLQSCGCVLANDSGFVVRADALHAVHWLPTYSEATGFALGKELLQHDFLSVYIDESLAVGQAPHSLHTTFALCKARARGVYQCFFRRHHHNGLAPISDSHKFLYNTLAIQHLVSALTMPLWVGIPVVQIIFAVFPWDVNGWFGIGFLAYYVFATPLLFQAYTASRAVCLWHSYTASYALGWSRGVAALSVFLCSKKSVQSKPTKRRKLTPASTVPEAVATSPTLCGCFGSKTKAEKDFCAPAESNWGGAEPGTPVAAPPQNTSQSISGEATRMGSDVENVGSAEDVPFEAPSLDAVKGGFCAAVPWAALLIWAVSGAAAGIGAWLIFATGTPHHVTMRVLAANLPLVLSTLWALTNHMIAGMTVCYALGIRRHALAVVSVLAQGASFAAVVLIGIAAVGLGSGLGGDGTYAVGGPAARNGFIWQMGGPIAGTPSQ